MKESLKRLGIKRGSILAMGAVFAIAPLPFLKGNPTGLIWTHDHAARYIRVNSINLDNHRTASRNMDYSSLKESRDGLKLQDYKFQLMLLEDKAERINESGSYTDSEKTRKMLKLEKRLDRLYDKIDKEGFRLEELRSANDKMMFADAR